MKTAEEFAQWVIDNRFPKNEKEKISDHEMYHAILEFATRLENGNRKSVKDIETDLRKSDGVALFAMPIPEGFKIDYMPSGFLPKSRAILMLHPDLMPPPPPTEK